MNVCAFCGPTRAKMDPEHVWSDWISRLLDKHYERQTYTITSWDSDGTKFSRLAKHINETRDYICRPCNAGWMSDIESYASRLDTAHSRDDAQGTVGPRRCHHQHLDDQDGDGPRLPEVA